MLCLGLDEENGSVCIAAVDLIPILQHVSQDGFLIGRYLGLEAESRVNC